MQLHISIAAETIGHLFGLPITNSLFTTWVVMAFILAFAFYATRKMKLNPTPLQLIAEILVGGLYDFFKSILGEKKVAELFPLTATIFIFVLVSNWAGLIPGLSAIGFTENEAQANRLGLPVAVAQTHEAVVGSEAAKVETVQSGAVVEESTAEEKHAAFIPLFRGPTADLNMTIALGLISVTAMVYYGVKHTGLGFFLRYFNFSNPIMTFVGVLELVSDFSKIISFAFRLFGNIFAGEVLLAVMAFLVPYGLVAPIPFLGLELFVGVIQALVFAMLTAVFIGMAMESHQGHDEAPDLAVENVTG